jgi:hypothetical protein
MALFAVLTLKCVIAKKGRYLQEKRSASIQSETEYIRAAPFLAFQAKYICSYEHILSQTRADGMSLIERSDPHPSCPKAQRISTRTVLDAKQYGPGLYTLLYSWQLPPAVGSGQ